MVTKAKKALLASLAAFLCVMLTVFGLSMSVSLSETAKAADETTTEVAEVNGVKYETLQAAIDAALEKAIVTLLADTRENVTIAKRLTLDLNGHTINGGTVESKPTVTVTARVTIKDSSADQTGTIMREDTAENSGVSSHYVIDVQGNGWLTFEGGKVINHSGVVGVKGASLVRVGDDSVAEYPGLNIKGGTFTQNNFVVIKIDRGDLFLNGGTLNSANSYAIENWHRATVKGGTVNGAVAAWAYSGGLDSTLDILDGTINGDVTSVNYDNADKKAKVSVTGGTINGKLDTRSYDPATGDLTSINDAAKATIEVSGGTFKENPSKYLVEDSAITENADGTFGVEKAYLARVGNTSYYTMDEAFKAQTASGEAIVLLRDYTTGSTFNSGSIHRVVDLNGHTWTCTSTDVNSAAFEINYPNVTLTVKNGKIISNTLVGLIPSAMGGTIMYDNAGLVFEKVEMTSNGSSGIETNGNNTNDSVTLINSTLNVPKGFGIYFPSSGTLTIDNSTIEAKTMGVQVCSGKLNINAGSAITVTGNSVPKAENDGAIQDGAAISIVNRPGYKGLSNIVITGGTFTAKAGNDAIKAYDWADKVESTFTKADLVAVSGGTFTKAVPAEYCADRFIPTQNEDGTYGVKEGTYVAKIGEVGYETLAKAIAAAKDGQTVMLLTRVAENVVIDADKNFTLDLNGFTLNGGMGPAKAAITNKGTLTIIDSSAAKTGTIKRDDNGDRGYYVILNHGTMTIEQANVVNNSGHDGSSLICNGDNDKEANLTINGGRFTQLNFIAIKNGVNGTLVVNGGEITSNQSAIQNWYNATIMGGTIKGQLWTDAWTEGGSVGNTVIGGNVDYEGEIVMDVTGSSIKPTLTVNGGNLSVTNWRITTACAKLGGKPAVSGGTFTNAVPAEYCAEGFIPTEIEAGKYGVKVGTYVAKIGEAGYETLEEAVNAAVAGQTVMLLTNVTVSKQLKIYKAITLDLNGKTLTSEFKSDSGIYAIVVIGATLTNGTIQVENARAIDAYGAMIMDGVTVENGIIGGHATIGLSGAGLEYVIRNSTINGAYSVSIFANNATVTIENSNITGRGPALYHNGSNYGLRLTVTDTTLTSAACSVYISGSASMKDKADNRNNADGYQQATFTRCTISGTNGIEVKYTNLTLNSCNISATVKTPTYEQNDNGSTASGFAVVSTDNATGGTTPAPKGTIAVSGEGNYVGAIGIGTLIKNTYEGFEDASYAVSGGTFSSEVEKDYLAKGYRLTKTGESYGVTAKYIETTHVSLGTALSFSYKLRTLNEGETIKNAKASYRTVRGNLVEIDMTLVNGYYVFDGITPQMLDRKISVNVYVGDTVVYDVVDYSILDYLQDLLNSNLGTKATVTKQLVADLAFYGKAAMKYVGYTTTVVDTFIANNGLTQSTGDITGVAISSGAEKVAKVSVQFASQNKILIGVDKNVINDYSYTIKVNGTEIDRPLWQTDVVDGYCVYVSDGFAARYITDKDHYVEVEVLKNGVSVQKVQCNVAGYCMKMAENAKMGELAKATYYYGVSAAKYAAIIKG